MTSAEWNFPDTHASFWGLRHYDKSQAGLDPTSPFADPNVLSMSDRQAVGIAMAFDSSDQVAKISHLNCEPADPLSSNSSHPIYL
jgi:hypothetical protein